MSSVDEEQERKPFVRSDGGIKFYYDDGIGGRSEHICRPAADSVKDWLDRQIILGGVSPEEARLVERIIGDLS